MMKMGEGRDGPIDILILCYLQGLARGWSPKQVNSLNPLLSPCPPMKWPILGPDILFFHMSRQKPSQLRPTTSSRQKNFLLDCTNKSASKWVSYSPLNDPFLKYIVPCPCNYFLVRKCANNRRLVFTVTEENQITLGSKGRGGRGGSSAEGKRRGSRGREGAGSQVSLGKIVRNGRR